MPTDPFLQSARDSSSKSGTSTIGEELTITGNVTSTGELNLEGNVQGDVHCVSLVLGENSQLEGSVIAEEVMIRGRLIGSVRALRVTLQSNSHVEGDLVHQSLAIEQGAYFEGKSRHSDNPLSTSPEERGASKPHLVAERAEQQRDKPATGFVRSVAESRSG